MTTPHITRCTGSTEWWTPPHIVAAARSAMGGIDLDPASSEDANRLVGATRFYSIEDDGLSLPWEGRVFLNPPYARGVIERFVEKLVSEYLARRTTAAVVLVNNATETAWGQRLLFNSSAVCFLAGRLHFLRPDGVPRRAPTHGQMACYLGGRDDLFREAFRSLGFVVL